MKVIPFYLLFLTYVVNITIAQEKCSRNENCGECIQNKDCVWCPIENFFGSHRCFLETSEIYDLCPENQVINPQIFFNITQDLELTRLKSSETNETIMDENRKVVQMKPQNIKLKLRPNQVFSFNFKYSQAEDYPIDLYYLMDLSFSMSEHKKKLSELGNKLATEMKKITRNFKLGFGSFVDKVVLPFTSTAEKLLKNPCSNAPCAPPYSYIHHMTLNTNTSLFAEEVEKAPVSGNIDSPEGGFDAIMQAIVCREQIGWRDGARRLLVFSTDETFHYAGDGKLGGIIEPNDGKCHMENNRYTHAEILDYPSVSHINHVVKENAVNIIFAVTKDVGKIYKELSKHIEGSSYGILEGGSSNVVDLIREEYEKISSGVEFKDNALYPIVIKYFTSCLYNDGIDTEQNRCKGLKDDSVINFRAEIMFTECPSDKKDWIQKIQIYPVGINESLTIDLEMICECDCEKPRNKMYKKNSKKCTEQGTFQCGLCKCNENYFGRKCECSNKIMDLNSEEGSGCRPDNTTLIDCSGRGTCICGVCECEKQKEPKNIISGPFCQCDNFSCDNHKGIYCSGEDHGKCVCGKCECQPGWMGQNCDCKTSNETCFGKSNLICSGHGKCECGKCNPCDDRYSGEFCEQCLTCDNHCDTYKNCVECKINKLESLNDKPCSEHCAMIKLEEVDKIEIITYNRNAYLQQCETHDKNNCKYLFEYEISQDEKIIEVRAEKAKCPPVTSAIETASYIIFPLLGFGLLFLLSWKVVTTIHDKREYSKFQNQISAANYSGDNPLYVVAKSEFQNPIFDD